MEFTFQTKYNQKAMKTMARGLRKTLRKKRNLRSRIFGFIICILGIVLPLIPEENGLVIDFSSILTWVAVAIMGVVLIWEDSINGYLARKRLLPGTEASTAVFGTDGYESASEFGKSEWGYDKIVAIAETKEYFVFVFSISHAQVYDKASLTGGTLEEFREFIQRKTEKEIVTI